MQKDNNLLIQLFKWATHQEENFTTEALAHLLGHLAARSPDAAFPLFSLLSGDVLNLAPDELHALEIQTQRSWTPWGTPDISIQGEDVFWLVEVKVAAPIDPDQLRAYLEILTNDRRPRKGLTLLATESAPARTPGGVHHVRWFDIADRLDLVREEVGGEDPVTKHLLARLSGYLANRRLAVAAVRSPLSEGIRAFEKRAGQRLVFDLPATKPVVSAEEELSPLWTLLQLMREAWRDVRPDDDLRYGSGQHSGGWIGWNVNRMTYFVSVLYPNPEVVGFQLYLEGPGVDPDRWDSSRGELVRVLGRYRWNDYLDLASQGLDFFSSTKKTQRQLLAGFIGDCCEYVDAVFLAR